MLILWQNNVYDIGYMKNWRQVFGDRVELWFWPSITAVGDGIEWEINVDESALNPPAAPAAPEDLV